jgi:hypothetical protein
MRHKNFLDDFWPLIVALGFVAFFVGLLKLGGLIP